MIFHENRLLADDSHEISYHIILKIRKDVAKSATVVIGALRVIITLSQKNIFQINFEKCSNKRSKLVLYDNMTIELNGLMPVVEMH